MKKVKKNILSILFHAFLSIPFLSCGGSGGGGSSSSPPSSPQTSNDVTITGNFTGGTHAESSWLNRAFAFLTRKAFALDPNRVSKVLIFSAGSYSYQSANVINGTFSVKVAKSNPIGMIFVGSDNEYLGYLYLRNNIASLPMSRVKSGVATIDLGALSSSGLVVEPSNNPLGNEIPMTPDEQTAFAQLNSTFATIVKNPDVDGNGSIDLLEGKKYFYEIGYHLEGGNFGQSLTPTISTRRVQRIFITFFSNVTNCPSSATVTGPVGSPFESPTTLDRVEIGSYCTHQYVSDLYPTLPPAGAYRVDYPDRTLTFAFPEQSNLLANALIPVPTVTLNDDGTIKRLSWKYKIASGEEEDLNPESMIREILINCSKASYAYPTIIPDSPSAKEVDMSDRKIPWEEVWNIGTEYTDYFNNLYDWRWYK